VPSTRLKQKPESDLNFEALGTQWYISTPGTITKSVEAQIHEHLEVIDKTWSRFRNDSLVATMSSSAGTYKIDTRDSQLLAWYSELYSATNGKVSPLIGQTISDAGYDQVYSLTQKQAIHQTPAWGDVIELTGASLSVRRPALIDVGAAGKGYAVDAICDLLNANDIHAYTIDAGGDIRTKGPLQRIGLEHPFDATKVIGAVNLTSRSICGSATNRRAWGDWHHIIDPSTSLPTTNIIATWVIADTAMIADGLATALFFVEPDKLTHLADFLYVIIRSDGTVMYSKHKTIELFI